MKSKILPTKTKSFSSAELNRAGHKKFPENAKVFIAEDNKQIKEIWDDITEGAEVIKDGINKKTGEIIPMRRLSDGTILKLRKTSDTGGSTIEIETKGISNNKKVHNRAREDGNW
ncbi:TPA: hypothetical protein SHD04_001722 [Campylobacter coli]|nr:hypothetical protein [Campylobacter coli]HEH5040704.1 hypothetical protein [Campylobacter coli]HEH5151759.1 hypothetical protein [Campylobacter coli]HEH5389524.1 hypothetical protein [Campylobacter coli]HEH5418928.1 hypothetical protein [Campylobacter coli]